MSNVNAPQQWVMTDGETIIVSVDCGGLLDSGELIDSVTGVTGSPSGLTISDVQKNTVTLTINNRTVLAGQAVQCKVTGGTANVLYTLEATIVTTSNPPQTRQGRCLLNVVA